ncbi:MAG: hypothetical protein M9949_14335 [Candidatus Kapabacteria bacterium]|nr:hypothetical protein [Candidatus Kapabacteria bacterium]
MKHDYAKYAQILRDIKQDKLPPLYELSSNDKVIMVSTMPKIRAYLSELKKNCNKQMNLFGETK